MKIKPKYYKEMPRIYHASADFAIENKPMTVCAVCRADGDEAPDFLVLSLVGGNTYTMYPCDSYTHEGVTYEIYRTELPADQVHGGELKYFIADNEGNKASEEPFLLPLVKNDELPPLPPLAITELFVRPKGLGVTSYIEVMNPTSSDVDLYDYEVLVFSKTKKAEGKPSGRLPLADLPKSSILHPGEFAAIWPIQKKNFGVEVDGVKRDVVTVQDFCDVFTKEYFYTSLRLTPDDCCIFPVSYTVVDPETGIRSDLPGVCKLPEKQFPATLLIVPRGGEIADAVFEMVYNDMYTRSDTPVKRSSYWKIDVRDPSHAVRITHADFSTPGYPGRVQAALDPEAVLPVIVPLAPQKEIFIGDGACRITFAVLPIDPVGTITESDVHFFLSDGTERTVAAAFDEISGNYVAVIPESVIETLEKLEYYITASDGTRLVSIFADEHFEIPVYDNAGPRITDISPSKYYAYDGTLGETPVFAEYFDFSGVKLADCRLWVDGKEVTSDAKWTELRMDYVPAKPFKIGDHKLAIRLFDNLGNRTEKVIPFSVSDMTDLNVYCGEVHSHTSDSDGTGFPENAMEFAKNVGKVDYFAVTDHSQFIPEDVYADQIRVADSYDEPGKFATIYGWEMTWNNSCGYWGHVNVLNSRCIVNNINENDLPDIYRWLEFHPESVAMFNHPGYLWGNFDEYAHKTTAADKIVCLSEIKGASYDREYAHMLSCGWHAAPVSNEDNHLATWTMETPVTGCVIAPSLTRQNIIDGFRARRTYATSDPTMKIRYLVNGKWLGSRIEATDRLEFDIAITTENERGIGLVEIVAEDNIVVAARNTGILRDFKWKPVLRADFDYYYIRITAQNQYTVTAPVWIENRPAPELLSLEYSASYDEKTPATLTAAVVNPTDEVMTDVRVSFIVSPLSGFRYGETEPYCTVYCGKLASGAALNCSRELPEISGMRRITAIVRAKQGKRTVVSTKYILISSLSLTEVVPTTQPYIKNDGTRIPDPFSYVTIYNSSPREIDLTGGKLSLWTVTGKTPRPGHIWKTDGVKIPPRSVIVVWDKRPDCAQLTVEDFNRRYGTSLTEGVDLFVADKHILSAQTDGRRLELSIGGEVVSRVHWNYGKEYDDDPHVGMAHKYVYRPNMTLTSTPVGLDVPSPGKLDNEQTVRQFDAVPIKRELKREKKALKKDKKEDSRNEKVKVTKKEAAAIATGAAAVAATTTAVIATFVRKKRRK